MTDGKRWPERRIRDRVRSVPPSNSHYDCICRHCACGKRRPYALRIGTRLILQTVGQRERPVASGCGAMGAREILGWATRTRSFRRARQTGGMEHAIGFIVTDLYYRQFRLWHVCLAIFIHSDPWNNAGARDSDLRGSSEALTKTEVCAHICMCVWKS